MSIPGGGKEIMLSEEDIFLPNIQNVSDKQDFEFFSAALNNSFGENLVWVSSEYDWVTSSEGLFVLNGSSANVGVSNGNSVQLLAAGLENTFLANSKFVEIKSTDGETAIIFDSQTTELMSIETDNADVTIFDMASSAFDLQRFSLDGQSLTYDFGSQSIQFSMGSNTTVELRSVGSIEPTVINYNNETYKITFGDSTVSFSENSGSFNPEIEAIIEGDLNEADQIINLPKEDLKLSESELLHNELIDDLINEESVDFSDVVEEYYDIQANSYLQHKAAELKFTATQATKDAIENLISDANQTINFEPPATDIDGQKVDIASAERNNQQYLESSLTSQSLMDYVLDGAIEFYDEI